MQYSIDQAFNKGIEFHKAGLFSNADYFYKFVLKKKPDHPYANHNQGVLCLDMGKVKDSLKFLQSALQTSPNEFQFWASYIEALIQSNQITLANKFYNRALELGANKQVFMDLKDKLDEINLIISNSNKINKNGDPSEIEINKIVQLMKFGNFSEALNKTKILLINYTNSFVLYNLSGSIYYELNLLDNALENFKIAIKLKPYAHEVYLNIGNVYKSLKDFEMALVYFEKALNYNPNLAEAYNCIGLTHKEKNNYDKSIFNFKNAIKLNQNNSLYFNNLGSTFALMGSFNEAIDAYYKSLSINPNFNTKIIISELLLREKKDAKNSLIMLEDALQDNPMDVRANAYKYIALRGMDRYSDAKKLVNYSELVFKDNLQNFSNENISDFNKKLLLSLENHPRRIPEINENGWAIRGGTVIRKIFTNPDPIIHKFESLLKRAIDKRIENLTFNQGHPFLTKKPENYKLECWVNFLESGDYQSNHIHNLGWMSGVYYVDPPEFKSKQGINEGYIEFNRAGYDLPHFGEDKDIELIKPENGMIVFFPSYVWHGTIPFTENKSKVSISFDISF